MSNETRTAGVPIRYAVTAVIDVYQIGLAANPDEPGAVVSTSALLPDEILRNLGRAVREHFVGHLTVAVDRFTRRNVERTELAFVGVAEPAWETGGAEQDDSG